MSFRKYDASGSQKGRREEKIEENIAAQKGVIQMNLHVSLDD